MTKAERDAERFNKKHPIGTEVRYWPWTREGEGTLSKTRSAAVPMSDHASVWVEGYVSCIALSHVEPVKKIKVTADIESVHIVAVSTMDAKGVRVVKIRRMRQRGDQASIVWKELRFVHGDFTSWPANWAGALRSGCRRQVHMLIEKHPDGFTRPTEHPTTELANALGGDA
jgi:hypothetical protein